MSLEEAACPRCGESAVAFGSTGLRHLFRGVAGTTRRACRSCGYRWLDVHGYSPALRAAAALLLIGGIFSAVSVARVFRPPPSETALRAAARGSGGSGGSGRLASAVDSMKGASSAGLSDADGAPGAARAEPGLTEGLKSLVAPVLRPSEPGEPARASVVREAAAAPAANFKDTNWLVKLLSKRVSRQEVEQVERMDKKQLWEKYGHYFGSKEEAKAAYNQYQQNREKIKSELK